MGGPACACTCCCSAPAAAPAPPANPASCCASCCAACACAAMSCRLNTALVRVDVDASSSSQLQAHARARAHTHTHTHTHTYTSAHVSTGQRTGHTPSSTHALARCAAPARRRRRVHQGCRVVRHRVGLAHVACAAARVRAAEDKPPHRSLAPEAAARTSDAGAELLAAVLHRRLAGPTCLKSATPTSTRLCSGCVQEPFLRAGSSAGQCRIGTARRACAAAGAPSRLTCAARSRARRLSQTASLAARGAVGCAQAARSLAQSVGCWQRRRRGCWLLQVDTPSPVGQQVVHPRRDAGVRQSHACQHQHTRRHRACHRACRRRRYTQVLRHKSHRVLLLLSAGHALPLEHLANTESSIAVPVGTRRRRH